ncbi:LysR family transcriptional regulator [Shewanella psychropiezotolerans]|uniref:LysR family transcriptional regulator n=1 Tax=Shewanella psychropiezotolerans TaxID=2593655 RepID=A0ABX5X411_9GAMM|nr:LysR family transcriptional regulator [Shewanella psychropiezotolerans]QDO86081.1 LysR family transcriptional regulator [Shewanella psychropiezotolerans]
MNKIDQLNYNQLKVFISVYEHGQSHQAANELGMTASAVSRTLKILREIFKDSLFIRRASGFVATEKTHQIIPMAKALVEQYQQIEEQHSVFTPAESGGQYIIHAYDEFVYAVKKVIRDDILFEAPNLRFDVRVLTHDCSMELANGDMDFVVVYEGFNGKNLNYEMFAETDSLYILARKDHPLLSQTLTLEAISHYPCLEIDNYDDLTCPLLVNLCREQNLTMEVEGYTDSLASAMRLLSESNAITLSCNQFTRQFVKMLPQIQYIKLPDNLAQKCRIRRRENREIGNYILFGNTNNSAAFNWVKSKLICGLEKEWRLASDE